MTRKKIFIALSMVCCMLIGMICGGCQKTISKKSEEIGMNEKIKELKVKYYDADDCRIIITIDFEQGNKIKKIGTDNVEEIKEAYGTTKELEVFIQEQILEETVEENVSEANSDEQRVLWRIDIKGNEHRDHFDSCLEYPEYWTELLELLGEDAEDYYSLK